MVDAPETAKAAPAVFATDTCGIRQQIRNCRRQFWLVSPQFDVGRSISACTSWMLAQAMQARQRWMNALLPFSNSGTGHYPF